MDPHLQYLYDMVRIINFFQWEQTSSLLFILENTHLEEKCTAADAKAGYLSQAFLGALVLVDTTDLGAKAHRVRMLWINMLSLAIL